MQTLALLFLEWLASKLGIWFEAKIGILCSDIVLAIQRHRARVTLQKNTIALLNDVKANASEAILEKDATNSLNNSGSK